MAKKTEAEKEVDKIAEKAGFEALGIFVHRGGSEVCVREYSIEDHGEAAKENAEEYARKIGGQVKKVR